MKTFLKTITVIIMLFSFSSCDEMEDVLEVLTAPKIEVTRWEAVPTNGTLVRMKIWAKNNSGADIKDLYIVADLKEGNTIKGQVQFFYSSDYDYFVPNEEILLGDHLYWDTGGLVENLSLEEVLNCQAVFNVTAYTIWENGTWVTYN